MIFGRFPPIEVVWPIPAQLGNNEDAPIEAAAKPVILRNSLLVCLPIIAPLNNLGSTPKKLVKTAALRLGFIAFEPPVYFIKDGTGYRCHPEFIPAKAGTVWHRQGAQVASQRSPILLDDGSIIQYLCRWHKALNPKRLKLKYSKIDQLYWMRAVNNKL